MDSFIQKVDKTIDQLLSFKGIDADTLSFKRTYAFTTLGISCFVALMFIPVLLYQVKSLLLFGILLLCDYIPLLFLLVLLPFRRKWIAHISQHIQIIITFYIIVRLGGLHHSGGIILAGLSMVMTSLMFNSIAWSIWYFSFYMVCMLIVAGIQMKFNFPPEMPSHVDHVFFLINTLCLTAYTLVIVLVHLTKQTQAEKDKADRLKDLDQVKTRLYTNITHEFRTPLTVILGMADQIETLPEKWLTRGLKKIRQHSHTLLNLVNQMLDLTKLEAGAMPINMVHGEVIRYLKYLMESFHSIAESQHIRLFFQSDTDSFYMDYDPEKLWGIISNLLSNAIKYSHSEDMVTLTVITKTSGGEMLKIIVKDTGIGISADKLEHIFDRFYQVKDNASPKAGGSGLGLAITRELIKLLRGEIQVESQIGIGTTFTLTLPVTHAAPSSETPDDITFHDSGQAFGTVSHTFSSLTSPKDDLPVLLFVEDNPDVTEYLYSLLEKDYFIEVADNGRAGFEKAVDLIPDIIISDIMMPEMDGIEMLGKIKNDIRTSHIPVILLTAKADVASRLEGLETGAEAYLVKPFNKDELFIIIRSLVELRKKLRERYASFQLPEPAKERMWRQEDGFMHKMHKAFQENLENENFGILQLCEIMAMSRAQLYRKFKALTNRSIKEYHRSFRLHIAKQLLLKTDFNVTEVAYQVGFKNLSHFSSCFRDEYGINPSDIRQVKY